MTEVFLYNIEKSKATKIKMLCHKLNISTRVIQKSEYGIKISVLLGLSDDKSVQSDSDFSEEMLYLVDFYGAMLDIFLDQLKKQKVTVVLKAVKTDTNTKFTSYELYKELSAEHIALSRR